MNNRIEELASKAWQYADLNSSDGDGRHGHLYRDKFAKLIVTEVLGEVLQAMDNGMDVYETVADKFGINE